MLWRGEVFALMRKPARTFESLSETFQERVYDLLVEKYTLRGDATPSKSAWKKIREQRPQSYRAWRRLNFFSMQQIDKAFIEKGLPPKHFVRTAL